MENFPLLINNVEIPNDLRIHCMKGESVVLTHFIIFQNRSSFPLSNMQIFDLLILL